VAAILVGIVSPAPAFVMIARTAVGSSRTAGLAAADTPSGTYIFPPLERCRTSPTVTSELAARKMQKRQQDDQYSGCKD
jgi:hypothetical protein